MSILEKLTAAADNHAEDTDEDHAVGDLQDMLRAAWNLMTPSQRKLLLLSDEVGNVIEAGARDELTAEDLVAELEAPSTDAPGYAKVLVVAIGSDGAPGIHTCAPQVTAEQVANGDHYDLAKENAEDNGYEGPMVAIDANDPAARQLVDSAVWLLS